VSNKKRLLVKIPNNGRYTISNDFEYKFNYRNNCNLYLYLNDFELEKNYQLKLILENKDLVILDSLVNNESKIIHYVNIENNKYFALKLAPYANCCYENVRREDKEKFDEAIINIGNKIK
jgi:hypothetical protein